MTTKSKGWKLGAISLLSGAALVVAAGQFIKAEDGRSIFDYWADRANIAIDQISTTAKTDAKQPVADEITKHEPVGEDSATPNTDINLDVPKPQMKTDNDDIASLESDVERKQEAKKLESIGEQPSQTLPQKLVLNKRLTFNILRVEKDGSTLIAGTAPPNSTIEIIEGEVVLGKSRAGSNGDFVALLDKVLPVGQHELFIRAMPMNEPAFVSSQSSIIVIPEQGGELLAMVSKPGEASQIVQLPNSESAAEVNVEKVSAPEVKIDKPASSAVIVEETAKIEKDLPSSEPKETTAQIETEDYKISIAAIDVEPNQFFVAGKSKPGSTVNIYINNKFKGWVKTGKEGAFLFDRNEAIGRGRYTVRADMISPKAKTVGARASVLLEHEMELLAAELDLSKKAEPLSTKNIDPSETIVAEIEPAKTIVPAKTSEQSTIATQPKMLETETAKLEQPKPIEIPETAKTSKATTKIKTSVTEEALPDFQDDNVTIIAEILQSGLPVLQSGRSVIIRRGDNLWKVSRRLLGAGHRYTTIYTANEEQISNPHLIFPGQVLDIPDEQEKPDKASDDIVKRG